MTTVVSDTSPIHYLLLIGEIHLLPALFKEVLIPPAVFAELSHSHTPPVVTAWIQQLPPWAKIRRPSSIDPALALDAGETEAISLALELNLPAILIDERRGRLAAESRGILAIGTLNILDAADVRKLVNLEQAVARLRRTNFHIADAIIDALLERARAREKT